MIHAELHNVYYNHFSVELDHNFFEIIPNDTKKYLSFSAYACTTLAILFKELLARAYGGGSGPIKNEGIDIVQFLWLTPTILSGEIEGKLCNQFRQLWKRSIKPVLEEVHQPDRRALDEVVFDVLGLTAGEREAVYEAVVELVRARLEKARSV